ncbi:MAG: BrnT family toxin [Selenomonadaceae bacterium]|nr:BrnT family toxin [Selenomonadaceae bacterium]
MGEIEVGEYIVEWDDEKNKINKKKHGISFETAANIFLDDNRIDNYDEFHSDYEDRVKVIGRVGEILTVIYTERGEKYRLISARQADKSEEEEYYGQYSYL